MPPKFTAIGTTLQGKNGEYVLKNEIARGGMGASYRAEDVERDRVVAIKEACLDPADCEGKTVR